MHLSLKPLCGFLFAASLTACASQPNVQYRDIESAQYLRPNDHSRRGHEPLIYNTDVDWKRYDSFMLDPVDIYRGPDGQFIKVSEQDKQDIAQYMLAQFQDKLLQRYTRVSSPRENTLRIRLTLTGVKPTKQFVGTATKFDLGGGPYNLVQSARGGQGMFGGSVSYAVEVYDASTNKLLKAYVDTQYPNAMNVKASIGRLNAARTGVVKGAESMVKGMD
jgi:hypothetical protein